MASRRAFVAGSVAAIALPTFAAKTPPKPKVGAIRWPGPGYELHGYMAVPAEAHGPQPAVLVLPDTSGADRFALGLTDALAQAGFVTCIPSALASIEEGLATVRWLATNRYATGKVGAVGIGWGAALLGQIVAVPDSELACGVAFGGDNLAGAMPLLSLPALAAATDAATYSASWRQTVSFLAGHLRQPHKH